MGSVGIALEIGLAAALTIGVGEARAGTLDVLRNPFSWRRILRDTQVMLWPPSSAARVRARPMAPRAQSVLTCRFPEGLGALAA
jgi:hypothetical protein